MPRLTLFFVPFLCITNLFAQQRIAVIRDSAVQTSLYLNCSGGGANRTAVAYNSHQNIYYSTEGGAASLKLETFNSTGTLLNTGTTDYDHKGLWYNLNTSQLEGNGGSSVGIQKCSLNTSFYATGISTNIFTANSPSISSVGSFNPNANEIIYANGTGNGIRRVNRSTNATIQNLSFTGTPVGSSINTNIVMYTGVTGYEYAQFDYTNGQLFFYNTTGSYVGTSVLPASAQKPNELKISYANNLFWIFDSISNKWQSFDVFYFLCPSMTGLSSTKTNVTCNGGSNGSANISISGSSTYTYIWSPVANNTASVSALPAGTYTVTISDTGLCTIPFKVTITQPAALRNNTITGAQTICSGSSPTALIGLTPTGEDSTNYAYSWLSSTTNATSGFVLASGTINTQNYTPGSLSQDTWFKRVVNSGACASDTSAAVLILINTTPQIVNQPVSGYSKSDSGAFVVKATGGALTYQWQKKTSGVWNDMSPFSFLEYSGANSDSLTLTAFFLSLNQIYFSDFMNGFYRCKISNACSSVYTDSVSLTTYTSVWTGGVDNNWNNNANWLYGETPSANQNIVVRSSAIYNPIVSGNVTINHLVIETGKNCSLNSNTDSLIINGDVNGAISGTGTYNGSKGTTIFRNTAPQFIPSSTYYNIAIQNSVFALLHGNVIIKNNITALIPLRIQFELLIDSNATYNMAVVKTEGAQSKLTIRNIGIGGRTGAVIFPVGATTTYNNPVTITNIGIADAFSVTLRDSVTNNYSGLIPIGAKINTNAVNRTWIINEETAGGSNATITLQWNAGDELSGFNRAASYISKHTAYGWMPNATVAASGTNPYTQTITGVTTFAPFGVGSSAALPVQLISFQAVKINQSVNLKWTTATEINNDYFIIERSIDGKFFEEITSVKGKGNSTAPSSYLYVDADAQNIATVNNTTTLFYRLKQVDVDGKTDLSEVITLNTDELNSTDITLQPNPSANQTAIIIHSAKAQQTEIQIKDITGNSISTQNAALIIGKNNIPLQGIEGLNEGIYIVIIKQGHQINTLKLVIKH